MDIVTTVAAMQAVVRSARESGLRIGFVPTMGFLHDGHLSLMRAARSRSDLLVASIFVNPTQFGPNEDLECYPRDLDSDTRQCAASGVDILFCPTVDEMYPAGSSVYVDECALASGLCGASRAGHFRGVLTVVAKLFNTVMPDVAVFGQKDAQQAALIRRMVRDLNYPIEIVVAPIVREPDGLAMSSRNTYLSEASRAQAVWLFKSLHLAESLVAAGTTSSSEVRTAMLQLLADHAPRLVVEYLAMVDAVSLEPVDIVGAGSLIAVAAKVGTTRLIDNVLL